MLKKRPRGKKKKKPSIKPHVDPTPTSIGSADGCFFISPPNSSHFLGRIGLVVFWLWKGNHRTAGAWIFQMTNVAHAYFWHIWLPQGNKTLLMQGDHLLSVAGVSEQADSVLALVRARTHTHIKDTHRHTDTRAGTRADRSTCSHAAGDVSCVAGTTHAHTHVLTAESVGSMHNRHALNSYTNWTLLFFPLFSFIQCVCQMHCKSRGVGDWECTQFLYWP